jgi:hypothetical protein
MVADSGPFNDAADSALAVELAVAGAEHRQETIPGRPAIS